MQGPEAPQHTLRFLIRCFLAGKRNADRNRGPPCKRVGPGRSGLSDKSFWRPGVPRPTHHTFWRNLGLGDLPPSAARQKNEDFPIIFVVALAHQASKNHLDNKPLRGPSHKFVAASLMSQSSAVSFDNVGGPYDL